MNNCDLQLSKAVCFVWEDSCYVMQVKGFPRLFFSNNGISLSHLSVNFWVWSAFLHRRLKHRVFGHSPFIVLQLCICTSFLLHRLPAFHKLVFTARISLLPTQYWNTVFWNIGYAFILPESATIAVSAESTLWPRLNNIWHVVSSDKQHNVCTHIRDARLHPVPLEYLRSKDWHTSERYSTVLPVKNHAIFQFRGLGKGKAFSVHR